MRCGVCNKVCSAEDAYVCPSCHGVMCARCADIFSGECACGEKAVRLN